TPPRDRHSSWVETCGCTRCRRGSRTAAWLRNAATAATALRVGSGACQTAALLPAASYPLPPHSSPLYYDQYRFNFLRGSRDATVDLIPLYGVLDYYFD